MIAQAVHAGFRVSEISVQARYFPEASSVNFRVSLVYGLKTCAVLLRYLLQRRGWAKFAIFDRTLPEVVSKYYHDALFRPD